MLIKTVADFYTALIHGPYAWPGGYPVYFVTSTGDALSYAAALANPLNVIDDIQSGFGGWRIVGTDINWEDADLICSHTYLPIESAYAD